jgi:hypothetical protein
MASLKRLSTDEARMSYWDGRLKYYRKLLSAYGTSFWPAKFASTALDVMTKTLTKVGTNTASGERQLATSEAHTTDTMSDGFDLFTSPSTPWSGVSYDFFPHNLTSLNEFDLNTDWWAGVQIDGQIDPAEIPA